MTIERNYSFKSSKAWRDFKKVKTQAAFYKKKRATQEIRALAKTSNQQFSKFSIDNAMERFGLRRPSKRRSYDLRYKKIKNQAQKRSILCKWKKNELATY